jgi:hypothetical protein
VLKEFASIFCSGCISLSHLHLCKSLNASASSIALSTGSRNHKSAGKKLEIQMLICKPREKQDLSTRKSTPNHMSDNPRKKESEYQPAHSKSVHQHLKIEQKHAIHMKETVIQKKKN